METDPFSWNWGKQIIRGKFLAPVGSSDWHSRERGNERRSPLPSATAAAPQRGSLSPVELCQCWYPSSESEQCAPQYLTGLTKSPGGSWRWILSASLVSFREVTALKFELHVIARSVCFLMTVSGSLECRWHLSCML